MNNEMLNDFCDETEKLLAKLETRLKVLSAFTIGYKHQNEDVEEQYRIQSFETDAIETYCHMLLRYITEAKEINERGEENDN